MNHPLPPAGRHGFTLVEMLVTTAIIAVLAALLVPAALATLQKGRATKLAGNMRTISAGMVSYAADNGGRFPAGGGGPNASWQGDLASYVGEDYGVAGGWNQPGYVDASVFRDPVDGTVGAWSSGYSRHTRNIALNGSTSLTNGGGVPEGVAYRLVSTITHPTELLMLTTGRSAQYCQEFSGGGMRIQRTNYATYGVEQFTRIPDHYYCVFADGHLEILPASRIQAEAAKGNNSLFFDSKANNAGQ